MVCYVVMYGAVRWRSTWCGMVYGGLGYDGMLYGGTDPYGIWWYGG